MRSDHSFLQLPLPALVHRLRRTNATNAGMCHRGMNGTEQADRYADSVNRWDTLRGFVEPTNYL